MVAVAGVLLSACGGGVAPSSPGSPNRTTAPGGTAATPSTGSAAKRPPSGKPTTTTTTDPGLLPQTTVLPSTTSPQFHAEMNALWDGIVTGSVPTAMRSFFPRSAYLQVKAISNPSADYANRLVAHFALDVAAAHALLGPQAAGAKLLRVTTVPGYATWIVPGYCYNRIGYWHLPGSRIVYEEGGQVRSIGIMSLISWRGVWYVVHLGGVSRTSDTGLVDSPSIGPGTPGPPGGC